MATAACVQIDLACPNFVIQEIVDPQQAPEAMSLVKEPLPIKEMQAFP